MTSFNVILASSSVIMTYHTKYLKSSWTMLFCLKLGQNLNIRIEKQIYRVHKMSGSSRLTSFWRHFGVKCRYFVISGRNNISVMLSCYNWCKNVTFSVHMKSWIWQVTSFRRSKLYQRDVVWASSYRLCSS